ncbi:putative RDD family membrane protein YckC [Streptomyces phaeoluteigriseus]
MGVSELVTGEAVALELQPARLPSRALATLLDLTVVLVAYVVVSVALLMATASLDEAARTAVSIATFLLVLVGGPIAVETLSHGRSLGKAACGLRVVRDDGGPIRFRHALVRGALGVVEDSADGRGGGVRGLAGVGARASAG